MKREWNSQVKLCMMLGRKIGFINIFIEPIFYIYNKTKKKILLRIEKIKSLKEDLPLDKLAEKLILNPIDLNITKDELIRRNIVTQQSIKIFNDIFGETNEFSYADY